MEITKDYGRGTDMKKILIIAIITTMICTTACDLNQKIIPEKPAETTYAETEIINALTPVYPKNPDYSEMEVNTYIFRIDPYVAQKIEDNETKEKLYSFLLDIQESERETVPEGVVLPGSTVFRAEINIGNITMSASACYPEDGANYITVNNKTYYATKAENEELHRLVGALYEESSEETLTEEQGERINYLINKLDMANVSYSFNSPRDLSMTSFQRLVGFYFGEFGDGGEYIMRYDMKEILSLEQLQNGFEDLFGTREIPFGWEYTNSDGEPACGEIPLTFMLQKGAQGLPEMGGIGAEFKTTHIEKEGNLIKVRREMHFHNEDIYFWDELNKTFYYQYEAEEKFGGEYDFEKGTKLPEGIEMRCFPSFYREMEYTFEILEDGHIIIKSGRVII